MADDTDTRQFILTQKSEPPQTFAWERLQAPANGAYLRATASGLAWETIAGTTYTGGDGIDVTGTTVSIDLATGSGLEFDSGGLRIDQFAPQARRDAAAYYFFGRQLLTDNTWRPRWWVRLTGDSSMVLGQATGSVPYDSLELRVARPVPVYGSAQAGQVLKVNAAGNALTWGTEAGKTGAAGLPAFTEDDHGKVLVVRDPDTTTGGSTVTVEWEIPLWLPPLDENGNDRNKILQVSAAGDAPVWVAPATSAIPALSVGGTHGTRFLAQNDAGTAMTWQSLIPKITDTDAQDGYVLKIDKDATGFIVWAAEGAMATGLPTFGMGNAGQVLTVNADGTAVGWTNKALLREGRGINRTTRVTSDHIFDTISVDIVDGGGLEFHPLVDEHGTAVPVGSQGIRVANPVPAYDSTNDRGKVLQVKSDGSGLEWVTP